MTALRRCCHHDLCGAWMVPIQLRPGRPALPRGPGSVRGPDGRRGSRRPERHAGACARPRPSSLSWATFGVGMMAGPTARSRGFSWSPSGRGKARREHLQQARPGSVGRRPPPDAGRLSATGALTGDTAGTDLTHDARSPASGYGTTAAGTLPLLTCTGSWGIGGTWGISSGAPLVVSASAAS